MEGLLDKNFVTDLKLDGTFNEDSFDREYESIWSGSLDSAFFSPESFTKNRVVTFAEDSYSGKTSKDGYYVLGVDVGRLNCTTEVVVMKVQPIKNSPYTSKTVVNIYSFDEEHFGFQAINIKKIFNKFKCKCAVIDANGLGVGLVDYLVQDNIDPDTGETLYNWGVINDDDGKYRMFRTQDTVPNAMYLMKANQAINSELYAYCKDQMDNNRVRFLITSEDAKKRIADKKMPPQKREEYLIPYVMTDILFEQMMNLVRDTEKNRNSQLIILDQSNTRIRKDKFSALLYALSYCQKFDDRTTRRKGVGQNRWMLFSKG
jgi:hypothetical protein